MNPAAKSGIQFEITEFGGQPAGCYCTDTELINKSLVGLSFSVNVDKRSVQDINDSILSDGRQTEEGLW